VQTAASEFAVLRAAGLAPQGKPSSVRDGRVRIMDALANEALPLIIASRCCGLIGALSAIKPHRSHPELYNHDHPFFSHPLDALRCLLVNIGTPVVHTAPLSGGRLITAGIWGRRLQVVARWSWHRHDDSVAVAMARTCRKKGPGIGSGVNGLRRWT
jgi:hypothetical protein